jgi:hypothetical protein
MFQTNKSSADSNNLLIVADAKGASSFPIIINKSDERYSVVPITSEKYRHKNKEKYRICSAAISPGFFGSLLLFRNGKVKFANWSGSRDHETLMEVAHGERLEEETRNIRGTSSMAFSADGMRALAVDRRGKVLALEFKRYRAPVQ